MIPRPIIFARSYADFLQYCRRTGVSPTRAVYPTRAETLRGFALLGPADVVFLPSWEQRPDADELMDALRVAWDSAYTVPDFDTFVVSHKGMEEAPTEEQLAAARAEALDLLRSLEVAA